MAKRVVFNEYRQKLVDENAVEVEVNENLIFTIPPVQLWDEDIFDAAQSGNPRDLVNALTDGKADEILSAGCQAATFLGMIYEGFGIDIADLGKLLKSAM